jgi:hypothetical protein
MARAITLYDAMTRVQYLSDSYAKEKLQREQDFIKILLPAALALATVLSRQVGEGPITEFVWFLVFFFGAYASLLYLDLYASERAYEKAYAVQLAVNGARDLGPEAPLPDDIAADFSWVESEVSNRRQCMPTGKPILAALAGAAAILVRALPT